MELNGFRIVKRQTKLKKIAYTTSLNLVAEVSKIKSLLT